MSDQLGIGTEDACADYVVADADWLARVPAELSAGAASMLPTAGAVALGALRTGRTGQGDTVLVAAGAGAIGHLAVQLARLRGAGRRARRCRRDPGGRGRCDAA